jgi:hypothetical protein
MTRHTSIQNRLTGIPPCCRADCLRRPRSTWCRSRLGRPRVAVTETRPSVRRKRLIAGRTTPRPPSWRPARRRPFIACRCGAGTIAPRRRDRGDGRLLHRIPPVLRACRVGGDDGQVPATRGSEFLLSCRDAGPAPLGPARGRCRTQPHRPGVSSTCAFGGSRVVPIQTHFTSTWPESPSLMPVGSTCSCQRSGPDHTWRVLVPTRCPST